MALRRATYTGVNDIMNAFDSLNEDSKFYYSLWLGEKDIAFQWPNADYDRGREFLHNNLLALEQAGNNDLYYLKFHPTNIKGFVDRKTLVISTIPVRVAEMDGSAVTGTDQPYQPRNNDWKMFEAVEVIKGLPEKIKLQVNEQLTAFDNRLKELEAGGFETEPEPDKVEKYIGQIGAVLNNPVAIQAITGLFQFLAPTLTRLMPAPVPGAISGIEPDKAPAPQNNAVPDHEVNEVLLNEALDILEQHCNVDTDLMLLAKLAQEDKGTFNYMLSMLRNRK